MFQVLALHQSGGEGLTLETSAFYSLQWLIYVFNSVVNTKLPMQHHSFFRNLPLYSFILLWIDVNKV